MLPYVARKLLNITSDLHGGGTCKFLQGANETSQTQRISEWANAPDDLDAANSSWSRRDLFCWQRGRLAPLKFSAESKQIQVCVQWPHSTARTGQQHAEAQHMCCRFTALSHLLRLTIQGQHSPRLASGCTAILSGRLLIFLLQHVCKSNHVRKHHCCRLYAKCNGSEF